MIFVVEVILKENIKFDQALKRFNRKVQRAGVLSDVKKHRYYEKPSDKRRRETTATLRKIRRDQRRAR